MIPLHTFDAARVLDGARVLLIPNFLAERPHARIVWCGDFLIMSEVGRCVAARTEPDRCDAAGFSMLALDPTDPDTARLIDRRIAEALHRDSEPTAALLWVDDVTGPRWRMSVISPTGMTQEIDVTHECLSGLEPTPGNLPEARRRLLVTLYPPVATCS